MGIYINSSFQGLMNRVIIKEKRKRKKKKKEKERKRKKKKKKNHYLF